jgi:hypothetical protein
MAGEKGTYFEVSMAGASSLALRFILRAEGWDGQSTGVQIRTRVGHALFSRDKFTSRVGR